ncbi:MAG TPA: hypothetical protein ENO23_02860 [Alphaproteobacteria bacterium]|nr:hypothetical protein [Alphaproteobacteria bacterium]
MNQFVGKRLIAGRSLMAAALVLALASGLARAQEPQGGGEPELTEEQRAQVEEFRQTRAEMMQVQQQLAQIQQSAVQARPELQEKQQEFGQLMMAEMKRQGHAPEEDLAELRALQGKLRNPETPEGDREALMSRLQAKAQAFQQAQQEAMQNPDVQKAQQELVQAITTAMREDNPQTEELLKQLQEKQRKLIQIRNEAMGQQ